MAPTIKKLPRAKSREEWLNNAIRLSRPIFRKLNCPLPKKVRAACSWTSHGARSAAIGQCWTYEASKDQTVEIHVSPVLDNVLTEGQQGVLDVFVHELGHAAAGISEGHKGEFARVARELGLAGPLTATNAGPEFVKMFKPIVKALGPYPHAELRPSMLVPAGPGGGAGTPSGRGGAPVPRTSGPRKQGTRMLKVMCKDCGYTLRTTRTWLEMQGTPKCPCNDTPMWSEVTHPDEACKRS